MEPNGHRSNDVLYHERQHLALCAVHAINNLLQGPVCTKRQLDEVCRQLAPSQYWFLNPHRSALGIGNYDVNVIMVVLVQQHGLQVTWHDSRKDVSINDLNVEKLRGVLWNVPANSILGRLMKGRHWVALLLDHETNEWMNLDSNLSEPVVIGSNEDCIRLLNSALDHSYVLLVHK